VSCSLALFLGTGVVVAVSCRLTAISVIMLLAASCASPAPQARPENQVGPDGFSVSVGSVTVSAGASVAPEGTSVSVEPAPSTPGQAVTYLDTISDAISITLGEGRIQPDTPIAIETRVDGGVDVDRRLNAGDLLVFVSENSAGDLDIHPAQWDPSTRVVSATTMHLSRFVAGFLSMQKIVRQMSDLVGQAAGQTFPRPADCQSSVQAPSGVEYTVQRVTRDVAWPCLAIDGAGGIRLDLHSNSPFVYRVRTEPPRPGQGGPGLDVSNIATQLVYDLVFSADLDREGALLPGGSVTFRYLPDSPPRSGELAAEAVLSYVELSLFAVDVAIGPFGGSEKVEAALQQAEFVECVAGTIEPSIDGLDFTDVFVVTADCLSPILATAPKYVLGQVGQTIIGGGPILATMWRGVASSVAELRGMDSDTSATFLIGAGRPNAEYIGTWAGQVSGDSVDYSVRAVIREQDGILVADVEYPELGCGGTWTQFLTAETTATFTEVITYGNSQCIDESTVEISPETGNLQYFIDYGRKKLSSDMAPAS